ncbi:rod-binding protein [Paraferrimonas sp. SM1919]|uniref:rod-binding protein n=1 Tax=Paraferrimonas sp. SM1919 TaxID=2662263 RepID=UPI0013D6DCB4|nr:rod-binding protein [Paraferrimonas sp. SM1919]
MTQINKIDLAQVSHKQTTIAKNNSQDLQGVASEFEALFLQKVLKHMRSASDALQDDEALFSTKENKFYRDMYDGKLAQSLSQRGQLGLANSIVKQWQQPEALQPQQKPVALNKHTHDNANVHPAFRASIHQIGQNK